MNTIFQVVTLVWSIQGGQYFDNAINLYGAYYTNDNLFIETSFTFQFPFSWVKGDSNYFFIGSATENQFIRSTDGVSYFFPKQDIFTFHAGAKFYGLEFGVEHMCTHPVRVLNVPSFRLYSSYDKIYAKVSGSF